MLLNKRIYDQNININVEGDGEPILFVHGFPLDHTMWSHQIAHFSKHYLVIAPDLRGFGKSQNDLKRVEMQQFAQDLAELLNTLAIESPVHFCGLSMGGYIAWEFYKNYRSKLKSLILCDTKAAADSAEARENRELTAQKVLAEGADFLADAMVEKLFSPHSIKSQTEMISNTQDVIRSTNPESIAAALRGMAIRSDMKSLLKEIDLPALLIAGEDDGLTPPDEMRSIAEEMVSAKFVSVPHAGHMAPLEEAQKVNEAIDSFLDSLSPSN